MTLTENIVSNGIVKKRDKFFRLNREAGIILIELIIVMIVLGVTGAITIHRITQTIDRAKLTATQSDVASMKMALALYEAYNNSYKVGTGSYSGSGGYEEFKSELKTYTILPDTNNFYPTKFKYTGDSIGFKIELTSRDSRKTVIVCTFNHSLLDVQLNGNIRTRINFPKSLTSY